MGTSGCHRAIRNNCRSVRPVRTSTRCTGCSTTASTTRPTNDLLTMTDPPEGLRIREAVRALMIDVADHVLLVRFEFPAGTRWALPGGGVEPGESDLDALRRELEEEVGLVDAVIGPQIWHRLHIVPFINGQFDGQRERITSFVAMRSSPRRGCVGSR